MHVGQACILPVGISSARTQNERSRTPRLRHPMRRLIRSGSERRAVELLTRTCGSQLNYVAGGQAQLRATRTCRKQQSPTTKLPCTALKESLSINRAACRPPHSLLISRLPSGQVGKPQLSCVRLFCARRLIPTCALASRPQHPRHPLLIFANPFPVPLFFPTNTQPWRTHARLMGAATQK